MDPSCDCRLTTCTTKLQNFLDAYRYRYSVEESEHSIGHSQTDAIETLTQLPREHRRLASNSTAEFRRRTDGSTPSGVAVGRKNSTRHGADSTGTGSVYDDLGQRRGSAAGRAMSTGHALPEVGTVSKQKTSASAAPRTEFFDNFQYSAEVAHGLKELTHVDFLDYPTYISGIVGHDLSAEHPVFAIAPRKIEENFETKNEIADRWKGVLNGISEKRWGGMSSEETQEKDRHAFSSDTHAASHESQQSHVSEAADAETIPATPVVRYVHLGGADYLASVIKKSLHRCAFRDVVP